jgi:glycosyltransferase involved in cell wall biosynthesis
MNIVALSSRAPLPLDNGDAIANWGLLRAICERHETSLLAVQRASTSEKEECILRETVSGDLVLVDPLPSASRSVVSAGRRLVVGVGTRTPRRYLNRHHPEIACNLRKAIPHADVVVMLDNGVSVYEAELRGRARSVLHMHNVDGWSAAEPMRTPSSVRSVASRLEVGLIRAFERRTLPTFTRVTVTSRDESDRLALLYGRVPDAVIPSSIDLPPRVRLDQQSTVVGWVGGLSYGPNRAGLIQFLESGWPGLAERGARLLIAGRCPAEDAELFSGYRGVQVLGYVDDLNEFFGRLGAGIVPLWSGAGVKLKTVTMMGAGVPLAVTPVAVEGIAARDGQHCLIGETAADLATSVERLLTHRKMAARLAQAARDLVAVNYTWDTVGRRFVEQIEAAADVPTATRRS